MLRQGEERHRANLRYVRTETGMANSTEKGFKSRLEGVEGNENPDRSTHGHQKMTQNQEEREREQARGVIESHE